MKGTQKGEVAVFRVFLAGDMDIATTARKQAARISCWTYKRLTTFLSVFLFRLIHYSVFLPFIRLCFSNIEMHQNVNRYVQAAASNHDEVSESPFYAPLASLC